MQITTLNNASIDYVLQVKDDSMHREGADITFPIGSFIAVCTELNARSGDFVVFDKAGSKEAHFRQYIDDSGVFYLRPLNPQFEKVQLNNDIKIIGIVTQIVQFCRPLSN